MVKTELNYEAAHEELTQIVADIENEDVSVDELAKKVQRAAELIKFCSGKLRSTEEAVDKIIREIDESGPTHNADKKGDLPF